MASCISNFGGAQMAPLSSRAFQIINDQLRAPIICLFFKKVCIYPQCEGYQHQSPKRGLI